MIAYIKGKLTYIHDEAVVVDVGGVGYEIVCPNPFAFQASLHNEVMIYTYHYVREDAQVLYGFQNEDQKYLFTKLISVSGIGPKGALAVLGSVDIPGFIQAIEQEDDKFLTSFPGIGKKTARQIILDLKGKLTSMISISNEQFVPSSHSKSAFSEEIKEAQEALKALGYTDKEVKAIQPQLQKEEWTSTDEIIRKALSLLVKK